VSLIEAGLKLDHHCGNGPEPRRFVRGHILACARAPTESGWKQSFCWH